MGALVEMMGNTKQVGHRAKLHDVRGGIQGHSI